MILGYLDEKKGIFSVYKTKNDISKSEWLD